MIYVSFGSLIICFLATVVATASVFLYIFRKKIFSKRTFPISSRRAMVIRKIPESYNALTVSEIFNHFEVDLEDMCSSTRERDRFCRQYPEEFPKIASVMFLHKKDKTKPAKPSNLWVSRVYADTKVVKKVTKDALKFCRTDFTDNFNWPSIAFERLVAIPVSVEPPLLL